MGRHNIADRVIKTSKGSEMNGSEGWDDGELSGTL